MRRWCARDPTEVPNVMPSRSVLTALGCVAALCVAIPAASAPVPKEGTTPYVRWSAVADPPSNGIPDLALVNDLVVVGTDKGEVRAYRTATGELAWSHDHGNRVFHRVSSDGERVFFASEAGLTAVAA